MAITWEPVGQQGPFKAQMHSLTKIIGVFEVHQSDPTTPKGGYSVNQVAQGGQQPYFQLNRPSHVARRLIFGMRPFFGPLLTILGKNLPGRAHGGQGGRMAIT